MLWRWDIACAAGVAPLARQWLTGQSIEVTENVDEKIGFLD